ncbi:MAG TPA: hypothetical protein ENJ79_03275 [Gammaproteobacteria bacterium]|nr:hypothetical protein [Gammaproteobacteria bacterium]
MQQEINLYQPVFRKQHKVFSAATLAQMLAAVVLLLALLVVHAAWSLRDMRASAAALAQQLAVQHAQLSAHEQRLRTPDTQAIDREIEALDTRIEQRQDLLSRFDTLALQTNQGFGARFRALASLHRPGLWLDSIHMDGRGHIELHGQALEARLVPDYQQRLNHDPLLGRQAFQTVRIDRTGASPNTAAAAFTLRNFSEEGAWN